MYKYFRKIRMTKYGKLAQFYVIPCSARASEDHLMNWDRIQYRMEVRQLVGSRIL